MKNKYWNPEFNSPISSQSVQHIQSRYVKDGMAVIDFGCGNGSLLERIVTSFDVRGVGIDIDEDLIEIASKKVEGRRLKGTLHFEARKAAEYAASSRSFDLAICMGSTHAFGDTGVGFASTLQHLRPLLIPEGIAVIGDTYWRKRPEPEYLERLGGDIDQMNFLKESVLLAREQGFDCLEIVESSTDDWNRFESAFLKAAEDEYADLKTPECLSKLQECQKWHEGYQRWGRDTLGFAIYVLRLAPSAEAQTLHSSR
jgi:cyclopropane fatty-acyl-phospholipid synthase-like methyltransferase